MKRRPEFGRNYLRHRSPCALPAENVLCRGMPQAEHHTCRLQVFLMPNSLRLCPGAPLRYGTAECACYFINLLDDLGAVEVGGVVVDDKAEMMDHVRVALRAFVVVPTLFKLGFRQEGAATWKAGSHEVKRLFRFQV